MQKTLYLTRRDRRRDPEITLNIATSLRDGERVAAVTREPEADLLDDVIRIGGDWNRLVECRPVLAIVDNLIPDEYGRDWYLWNSAMGSHVRVSAGFLEELFSGLREAGTRELILICEEPEIGTVWRDWCEDLEIRVVEGRGLPRRRWWLRRLDQIDPDPSDPGSFPARLVPQTIDPPEHDIPAYRYRDDHLQKRTTFENPRVFESHVISPESEALLAMVGEYCAMHFEHENPDELEVFSPACDRLQEIIRCYTGFRDPTLLLDALEELWDLVADHVIFPALGGVEIDEEPDDGNGVH